MCWAPAFAHVTIQGFYSRLLLMPFLCCTLSSHVWRSKASLKLVFINKPSSCILISSHTSFAHLLLLLSPSSLPPNNVVVIVRCLLRYYFSQFSLFNLSRSFIYIVARRHRILNTTLFCYFESITKLPLLTLDTFSYIIISFLLLLARFLMRRPSTTTNGDEATGKKERGKKQQKKV